MKYLLPVLLFAFMFAHLNSQSAEGSGTIMIVTNQPNARVSIPLLEYKKRIPGTDEVKLENVAEGVYFIEFRYDRFKFSDSIHVIADDTTAVLGDFRHLGVSSSSLKEVRRDIKEKEEKSKADYTALMDEYFVDDTSLQVKEAYLGSDTVAGKYESIGEEVFYIVEEMPKFNGGDPAIEFRRYISMNLIYPEEAARKGCSGTVIIQFKVNRLGKVIQPVIISGQCLELNREAIRVVLSSPPWEPGRQRGKAVGVLFTFPVKFSLQ